MHRLLRIIDANFNRSCEGLRVCEDVSRFILNDKKITSSFKKLRHAVSALIKTIDKKKLAVLKSRNSRRDVGKKTTPRERRRKDIGDIFYANVQRAKESLRVLEEVVKLLDTKKAQRFKKLRFRTYELEKKTRIKLEDVLSK